MADDITMEDLERVLDHAMIFKQMAESICDGPRDALIGMLYAAVIIGHTHRQERHTIDDVDEAMRIMFNAVMEHVRHGMEILEKENDGEV